MSIACSLAFEQDNGSCSVDNRLNIIIGSIISAAADYLTLYFASLKREEIAEETPL
jgi:Na+/H+ antiporter NhaA